LAYGAVLPWAYFLIGLTTAVISLILLACLLHKIFASPEESLLLPYPPLWWLAVGLVILTIIQVISWPQGLIARLSPKAWEIRALGNGYGLADFMPLSLNPYATLLEGLKLWPAVVLFFILIYTVDSRRKIQVLVGLIMAVGLFEVFYGFWHFHSHLIWSWKNTYTGSRLCGTFVNSNNLATFLTMAILLGFGLFLGLKETARRLPNNASGWERLRRWSRSEHMEPQLRRLLLLFLLLLLAVGLIFTGSRGGMVSLLMGFGLMALLTWSQKWRRGQIIIMVVFLGGAILSSLFLGSEPALDRFSDLNNQKRYQAFKGALVLFKEFPIFGSGMATFGDLFYQYQPAWLKDLYFMQTHNDWLQLLAETGLPGFSLVVLGWVVFFSVLTRQWGRRRQGFARGLTLGGMASLSAGVVHGLMDFPFHIPAISLTFTSIAAITYSAAHYHRQGREFYSYRTLKLSGNNRTTVALLVLAVVGLQLVFGVRVCYNWLAEHAAPTEVNSTRIAAKLAGEDFRRALAYNPTNSKYYLGLAETLEDSAIGGGVPSGAEKSLKAAIFYAPANWGYRLKLGEFYLKHYREAPDRYIPSALHELAAAVKLFPESGMLHFRLAAILAWTKQYYPGLIPGVLEDSQSFHFAEAVRLEPRLEKDLATLNQKLQN
jgi:O-antigen ligase